VTSFGFEKGERGEELILNLYCIEGTSTASFSFPGVVLCVVKDSLDVGGSSLHI
jgi:hypothetical protein